MFCHLSERNAVTGCGGGRLYGSTAAPCSEIKKNMWAAFRNENNGSAGSNVNCDKIIRVAITVRFFIKLCVGKQCIRTLIKFQLAIKTSSLDKLSLLRGCSRLFVACTYTLFTFTLKHYVVRMCCLVLLKGIQGVLLIISPSTAVLSYRKPGTSCSSCL